MFCCCTRLISDYRNLSLNYTVGKNPYGGGITLGPSGYHPWSYTDLGTGYTQITDVIYYFGADESLTLHVNTWRRWSRMRVTQTSPSGYTKTTERVMSDILYGLGDGTLGGTVTYNPDQATYDADPQPVPVNYTPTRVDGGTTVTLTLQVDDGSLFASTEYYFYDLITDDDVFTLLESTFATPFDWSTSPNATAATYGGQTYLLPQRSRYLQSPAGTGNPLNWIQGSGIWFHPDGFTLKRSIPDPAPAFAPVAGYAFRGIARCPFGANYHLYQTRLDPVRACVQRGSVSSVGCLTGSTFEPQASEVIDATNPVMPAETNAPTWDGSHWVTPTDPVYQTEGRVAIPWNGPQVSDRAGCTDLDRLFRLGAQFDIPSSEATTCSAPAP